MFEQIFTNFDEVLWKEAGCTSELDYRAVLLAPLAPYLDGLEAERAETGRLDQDNNQALGLRANCRLHLRLGAERDDLVEPLS